MIHQTEVRKALHAHHGRLSDDHALALQGRQGLIDELVDVPLVGFLSVHEEA